MEEREPKIKKAILNGRQLTVTYTEYRSEGDKDITVKSDIPAHKDCTDAFKRLVPHFILLTEMKEADKLSIEAESMGIENISADDGYLNAEVTGIKIGKNDNNTDTVTIIGGRLLKLGGSVDFSSPAQELESSGGEFEYPYINELNLVVQGIIFEVKQYLFNGKYAINQTTIDFEAVPDAPFESGKMIDTDTGEITPITSGKKRGRKKTNQPLATAAVC